MDMKNVMKGLSRIILLTIVGIFGISSCTNLPYIRATHRHKKSEPELMEYIKLVNIYSRGRMGDMDVSIGFVPNYGYTDDNGLKRTILGSCHSVLLVSPEIDINKTTWKYMNWSDRFLLVAHELYHCECRGFKHINKVFSDGCPKHYMHKTSASTWCVDKYMKRYLKQIKKGCN
jgi:hypothetical protein